MAGPLGVITTSGRNIGIKYTTYRILPPPFIRRLAGSSVIDSLGLGIVWGVAPWPNCPRAPRNAPVPPTIALLPWVCARGDPGDGKPTPPPSPAAMMLPIGVLSVFKISNLRSIMEDRVISAIASPGFGAVVRLSLRIAKAAVPLAGWPLTATMSARTTVFEKFLGSPTAAVTFGLVASFEISEAGMSSI